MRLSLWLILIFTFSVGMCCAFAVRSLYFEAQNTVIQSTEPTAKILVAKQEIPRGVEITADFVVFQDVPISEVPSGTLNTFAQVYRRTPAYPIPVGCPICEDLLAPPTDSAEQAAFLPAGSQFVTLDVVQIRQGSKFLPLEATPSESLVTDKHIDVRVVPKDQAQGTLVDKKNEVLRHFVTQNFKESGELLLENVPIHQVQRRIVTGQGIASQVVLVLDKSEADQLTAAAKKGQIRIIINDEPETVAAPIIEMADSVPNPAVDVTVQPSSVAIPFEPQPLEVPLVADVTPSISAESASVESTAVEPNVAESNVIEPKAVEPLEAAQKSVPAPKTPDIFDSALPAAPVPEAVLSTPDITTANVDNKDNSSEKTDSPQISDPVVAASEFVKEKIRNDSSIIAFGTPSLRVISERIAEQKSALVTPLPPNNVPNSTKETNKNQNLSATPYAEPPYAKSMPELPRISHSLVFQAPNNAAPTNDYLHESILWTDSPEVPTYIMPTDNNSAAYLSTPLSLSSSQEKMQGYSPFERRTNTPTTDESQDILPPSELYAPPRLYQNTDTEIE